MLAIPQPKLVRNLRRSREIARILARHGFAWALAGWDNSAPARIQQLVTRVTGRAQAETFSGPKHVRLALEELGTTFIKLGQTLSTRPDLVPPDYLAELVKLQDNVRSIPYDQVAEVIERELGQPPEQLFASFERVPRAAASIAQVHRAILRDGSKVIVKVQRPGIEAQVAQDLAILSDLASFWSKRSDVADAYDLTGLVEEFSFNLLDELDFGLEGRNADRMRRNFAGDAAIHIPEVHWEYSTVRVLVQEEITGIKISDLAALDAAGIDRQELAARCARVALIQIFKHGFFHADPHSGNFFVEPDGTIGLIDFGLVGRLDKALRESLLRLMLSIAARDTDRLVDELLTLGVTGRHINRKLLKRDLDHLIDRFSGGALRDISGAQVFGQITAIAFKNQLQLPAELTLLAKVVVMDEGLGTSLDPDFQLMEFAQPYFKDFWKEHLSPKAIARRVRDTSRDLSDITQDFPRHLKRLMSRLERGELGLEGQLAETRAVVTSLHHAANRISFSVLIGGALIGLGVAVRAYRPGRSQSE
jgi:ubiquinone biosynthesis protein